MRRYLIFIITAVFYLYSETLFEVKDASNNKVLDISTDGLRVMNQGDTLMVISSNEIKANISSSKGLSRTFSVTTNAAKGQGIDLMRLTADSTRFWISDSGSGFGVSSQAAAGKSVATDFLRVSNSNTEMREGTAGERYTGFSPENIFLGLNSGINTIPFDETSGENNVFLGNQSGQSNTSGASNVFLGYKSGFSNDTGYRNCFIGQEAGYSNINGFYNVFVGYFSGNESAGTFNNTFVGHEAGKSTVFANEYDGCYNAFFGSGSGATNTTGTYNSFFGAFSGTMNSTGSRNAFFGRNAGFQMTTGSENTGIGQNSSRYLKSGNYNTSLGVESGYSNELGSRNIFLGYRAGFSEIGSDKLYIDNSGTADPLIYGEFDNDSLQINGDLNVTGNASVNGKLGVGINPLYNIHSEDITVTSDNPAIFGKHNVTDSYGVGVRGEGGYRGVIGYASATSFECRGLYGIATGTGTGARYGVYGEASGGDTNWAGYFFGNVRVTGTINPTKIISEADHPLDPENKILTHSSVSSSEMLNVYSGNVILDGEGKAAVEMPEWFEAYNAEFRYQLTGIGSSAPGLFISEELENGKFAIGGGNPGMKVSWMVTAVRNDNYAKANPVQTVKEKKENEKGYYLTPQVFGRSKDMGIESIYEREVGKER